MKTSFKVFIYSLFVISTSSYSQNLYSSDNGRVRFISATPVENIEANSDKLRSIINVKTRDVYFVVAIKTFNFVNKLMQEHFNEKYMESDSFPTSEFKGKINESIDFAKNGTYKVTATGTFKCHGIPQNRTVPGTLVIKDGNINLTCNFQVKLTDHKIEVPTLVLQQISEVIEVKVNTDLSVKKKKT